MLTTVWPENLAGIKFGGLALKSCEFAFGRLKFGILQALRSLHVKSRVSRLRWGQSLRWRAAFEVTTSTKTSGMRVKERNRVRKIVATK